MFSNRQSFLTNQLTEHSSRQSGDYLPGLILVVNILLWSNTVFIITRHGLHGKPALYIYRSCYLLQQCGFIKLRFKIGQPNFTSNDGRYYVSQRFDHMLKFQIFWFYICRHHTPPDGTTAVALEDFLLQKVLWKVHHPKEEQVAVIMHEGISTSKVSASLLQGNTVPTIRSLFFAKERQF